jgi:murein DD-endopeptidase MepM/ murein hydrolase activator NlpD
MIAGKCTGIFFISAGSSLVSKGTRTNVELQEEALPRQLKAYMQIVFLANSRIGSYRFKVGVMGAMAFAGIVAAAGAGAYYAGTLRGESDAVVKMRAQEQSREPIWKGQIEEQRDGIAKLNSTIQLNVNAIAVRLGEMQAHVARLNALGERLASMAQLAEGEFDFSSTPAAGGPAPETPAGSDVNDIARAFAALTAEIDDRAEKLEALEAMLLNRDLQEQTSPAGWPLKGGWISSTYGRRVDPLTGRREFHSGVDFVGPPNSKVVALATGVVSFAGPRSEYGNVIEVNHGEGVVTRYAHNKKILAKVGEKVEKGQEIAVMGATGRTTGPHVHFEVIRDGVIVDPVDYIKSAKDASRNITKQDS